MLMSDTNLPPTPLNNPAASEGVPVESEYTGPPRLAFSEPEVQAWLNEWVTAVYAGQPRKEKPEHYMVPISFAGVALMEQFNEKVQALVGQYPEEHRKNQLIPVLVLARAMGAWQDAFQPSPTDWLNMRTNMGYYQQQHQAVWREQFEGSRPSVLSWLNRLPEAVGYELVEKQTTLMSKSLKASENAAPRFWGMVEALWVALVKEHPPASIQDNLNLCTGSIALAKQMQDVYKDQATALDVDALPVAVATMDPLDMAVPVRDYHKGWDYQVRTAGRAFALESAKSHYPEGIPDTPQDRVDHLKLVDKYYNLFERSFEPWRWDGLGEASVDEKAQTWAWLTSWAPEYHWDSTVQAFGIYPPVEAIGREYTGQSTEWWLSASYEDKVVAASKWIEGASYEMDATRAEHCKIDDFISGMFRH